MKSSSPLHNYLSPRLVNLLHLHDINTLEDLTNVSYSDLEKLRGFGSGSAIQIQNLYVEGRLPEDWYDRKPQQTITNHN